MDSILDSVKNYCGIMSDDTSFDNDILMAINAVMIVLSQLGVGPSEPFVVEDSTQEWSELLGDEPAGLVREYVNMRARMLFDPPTSSQLMEALKNQIDECEWRIIADVDKAYYETREVNSE